MSLRTESNKFVFNERTHQAESDSLYTCCNCWEKAKKVALSILRLVFSPLVFCWNAICSAKVQEPRPPKFNYPAEPLLIGKYVGATYENVLFSTERLYNEVRDCPKDSSEMQVSSACLRKILSEESYAVLCAWPCYPGQGKRLVKEEISLLEQRMESYFAARKIAFVRAEGHYQGDRIPNSYIVPNSDRSEMIALAKCFAQKSMITSENGVAKLIDFWIGKSWQALTWSEVPQAADDYTEVRTVDGIFKFTINFNWNSPSASE